MDIVSLAWAALMVVFTFFLSPSYTQILIPLNWGQIGGKKN